MTKRRACLLASWAFFYELSVKLPGQVFCITHLPQTAAIADHHYFIYKKEMDGRTVTQVRGLSEGEHVLEIARMFAGNDTTKASIEAARQIVKQVKGM